MTKPLYEELKELAEKATPGPWWTEKGAEDSIYAHIRGGRPNGEGLVRWHYYGNKHLCPEADVALVCALRNNVPAILSALKDSERWNALLNCPYVRLLGYARGGPQGGEGPIRHIGFEFTADFPNPEEVAEVTKVGRETLIEFADAAQSQEDRHG